MRRHNEMIGDSKINNKIANMSFVCALLVVAIHVDVDGAPGTSIWLFQRLVKDGIARIAVPFFFTVSGYFLSAHFGEPNYWGREVKKRIFSLLVPFVIWNLVVFILIAIVSCVADMNAHRIIGQNVPITDGRWLRTIGLRLDKGPIDYPLWYVRCLFIFVAVSPLFKYGVSRLKLAWLGVWFIAAAVHFLTRGFEMDTFMTGFFDSGFSLEGCFYFSVGVYLRLCATVIKRQSLAVPISCAVAGTFLLAVQVWFVFYRIPIDIREFWIPFCLVAVYSLIPCKQWPHWLLSCAFPIFLIHALVIILGGFVWGELNGWLRWVIDWGLGVGIPICFTILLKRYCKGLAAVCFGGRQ